MRLASMLLKSVLDSDMNEILLKLIKENKVAFYKNRISNPYRVQPAPFPYHGKYPINIGEYINYTTEAGEHISGVITEIDIITTLDGKIEHVELALKP